MTTPQASALATLAGHDLGGRDATYSERDAILYALAIGATADELDLVYEQRLRVLPTFALTLGLWAVEAAAEPGGYDRSTTLHVGQTLVMHRPLPAAGTLRSHAHVEAVWDKGSSALVVVRVSCDHYDARYTIFVPGAGGFGGERGERGGGTAPGRDPDARSVVRTWPEQAVLYRLTGDRHPAHIDPAATSAAGLDRPILHGLATLGGVALEIARASGLAPWELAELETRFAAPVVPGDAVEVATWSSGPDILFEATVGQTSVLKGGRARFA